MSNNKLLTIEPEKLHFLYVHGSTKHITRSLYLTNETNENVAFKIKTTCPKDYSVRPCTGVIPRRSSLQVLVTRVSQKIDWKNIDLFYIQSVKVGPGVTDNELTREMFTKELEPFSLYEYIRDLLNPFGRELDCKPDPSRRYIEETKLTVSYVNSTGEIIPQMRPDTRCLTDFG